MRRSRCTEAPGQPVRRRRSGQAQLQHLKLGGAERSREILRENGTRFGSSCNGSAGCRLTLDVPGNAVNCRALDCGPLRQRTVP
jgi:hypothetical protein